MLAHPQAVHGSGVGCKARVALAVRMKTEQKYFELTTFVFYIMNRFLT
jgi:hypothetical protein